MKKRMNTDINVSDFATRPIKNNGKVLNNEEFVKLALSKINEFEKENNAPAPISPNFKEWLKETATDIDNGVSVVEHISNTVIRQVPIALAVANANKDL